MLSPEPPEPANCPRNSNSVNGGETDLDALLAGGPQAIEDNPDGEYRLFPVGDAVASRDTHAAMLDAIRLCKDL